MSRPIRIAGFIVWLDTVTPPPRTTPREFAARIRHYLARFPARPTF